MADIKNINQDRDNGIWGELLTAQDNEKQWTAVDKLGDKQQIDTSENPTAKSQWSTGRGCPKCKGTLAFKEVNSDSGQTTVFCNRCGTEYHAPDIENTTAAGDAIHRQIPDELVNRWMEARENELNRK